MSGMIDGLRNAVDAYNRGRGPRPRPVYVVTPLGQKKAESFDLPENKWKVLNCLRESEMGPSSIPDIASHLGMSEERVKAIVIELVSEGFLKKNVGGMEV